MPVMLSGITQIFQATLTLTDAHDYSSTLAFNLRVSCRVFSETVAE